MDQLESDSSTRLMMEQLQAIHRRLEAETIAALIRHAQSVEAVHAIINQRLDSLMRNEDSLGHPIDHAKRLLQ